MEEDKTVKREVGEHTGFFAKIEPDKVKDLGEGTVEAIITSNAVDHHGEQIDMAGVDTSAYHGTVLYGHDYEGLPIGKTLSMTKFKNQIKARFQLAVKEYPFAQTVYDMIKGGYLTDVSIGGLVTSWSEDYKTIEGLTMKEFSVVPIGANPQALITAKSLGLTPNKIHKQYEDFVHRSMLDKVKDMGDDELKQSIKVLENLLATLKESAKANSSAGESEPQEVRHIRRIRLLDTAKAIDREVERTIKIVKFKVPAQEK